MTAAVVTAVVLATAGPAVARKNPAAAAGTARAAMAPVTLRFMTFSSFSCRILCGYQRSRARHFPCSRNEAMAGFWGVVRGGLRAPRAFLARLWCRKDPPSWPASFPFGAGSCGRARADRPVSGRAGGAVETNLNRDANHGHAVYSTGIAAGFSSRAAGPQVKESFSALPKGGLRIRSKPKKSLRWACDELAIVFAVHETGPQVGERPFSLNRSAFLRSGY